MQPPQHTLSRSWIQSDTARPSWTVETRCKTSRRARKRHIWVSQHPHYPQVEHSERVLSDSRIELENVRCPTAVVDATTTQGNRASPRRRKDQALSDLVLSAEYRNTGLRTVHMLIMFQSWCSQLGWCATETSTIMETPFGSVHCTLSTVRQISCHTFKWRILRIYVT